MISIIISSYQPQFYNSLEKNISETCGINYEIIKVSNDGVMDITKAYNLGAQSAIYPYLLFLHEDVIFHTQKWGEKLIAHFNKPDTGIIGVAGSLYVPYAPSGWYVSRSNLNYATYIQNTKNKLNPKPQNIFPPNTNKTRAFAIDGVFMAITKENFIKNQFCENMNGFHGYDLEISLRYSETLNNFIINDITIEHFSPGNMDEKWFDNNIIIREKFKNSTFQKSHDSVTETKAFEIFLRDYMKYKGISLQTVLRTFRFFPTKRIKYSDKLKLLKLIYMHLRYKKEFEKKYKILNA